MIRRLFTVAYCLSSAIAATAQVNAPPPPQTEQTETGFVPPPGPLNFGAAPHSGPVETSLRFYRIRLLPVSSFPQLPPPVAQQLIQRGCMIPQTYEAHQPENVIHGSFEKKGSSDWAALCSVKGVTTLYAFFQSNPTRPISLRHQPDTAWLGRDWAQDYGSAWGIATHSMQPADHADHDGIDDSFVEKSTTVHYFDKDQWTTLDGSP